MYNGTGIKYFLLVDEISELLVQRTPRKEFTEFLRMMTAQGPANEFFGGFLGAGTYHSSLLLKTPEPTPANTPPDTSSEAVSGPSLRTELSVLLKSSLVRSPFQRAHYVPIAPLELKQTLSFLEAAQKENGVEILDTVKSDLHFFCAGNLGLVAFAAHLLLKECAADLKITMRLWESLKLNQLPPYLEQENRMVKRIVQTLRRASVPLKQYILELLLDDSPMSVRNEDRENCNELMELGLVSEHGGKIAIASPYLNMLLLHLAYPERLPPTLAAPIPLNPDQSINSFGLLCLGIRFLDPKVISSRYSANRQGPSEVCLQAELFAAFKSMGKPENRFDTFLEVKREPGTEQRLDLLLSSRKEGNFAGYELKVNKLRKKEMVEAVEKQAEKFRRYHDIRDMFVVNFVISSASMDDDMPDRIQEVNCVYVRYDTGFTNVQVRASAIGGRWANWRGIELE
ncbi:hypothetical protein HDV00_001806 [Rhizophlyctis rosea]|nr:hypothetical protein HDV00_001806 [Rhizophlyctis rosea]